MPAGKRSSKARLTEAEETLSAIRDGRVDGLMVQDQVFTLRGTENPYRLMVEEMKEGAVTLVNGGTIAYCNPRFAEMLEAPVETIVGAHVETFVSSESRPGFRAFLAAAAEAGGKAETELTGLQGRRVSCHLTASPMNAGGAGALCLLAMDITAKKRTEERVQASLREKELLLREVYHRVKNNLQVISSLFRLQSTAMDEAAREVFRASQARLHAMALVHQKLCQSKDLSRIELREYLGQLVRDLFQTYSADHAQVSYHLDVCDAPFGLDTAVPLGLIASELISNAIKHAFPAGRKGAIRVALAREEGGDFRLTVADDGVGMAPAPEGGQGSFGLWIVRTLAAQVRGTFRPEAAPQGTAFSVSFPDPGPEPAVHAQA